MTKREELAGLLRKIGKKEPKKGYFDGCTSVPDFIFADCCLKHDYHYWVGGTKKDRLFADREFRACMMIKAKSQPRWLDRAWYKFMARVYYTGVRVFGASHFDKER